MTTRRLSSLKDTVGTPIEEGDIIAYAVAGAGGRGATLRYGTVTGFTDKSIRVDVPEKTTDKTLLVSKVVSKEKTENVIVVTKKSELEAIERLIKK